MAHTSSDPNVFILPDLGEGVHEAELISWKVKPGDHVEEHDIIAEMETDKALVEVPSPRAGVIKQLFGEVGEILKVGNVAWTYEGAGDVAGQQGGGGAPPPPVSAANEVIAEAEVEEEREDAGTVVGSVGGEMRGVSAGDGKALATPKVRRIARDLGVDIDAVKGSGIGGRVTEKDVRAVATSGAAPAAPAPAQAPAPQPTPANNGSAVQAPNLATRRGEVEAPAERPAVLVPHTHGEQRLPMRGVRRTIAARLRQSVDTAVHFSVMDDADVTEIDALRSKLQKASGEKLSYLPFVVSAMCRALKEFPMLNATVDDDASEIVRHNVVNMGIAADTEQGLSVPVIPDADALGILEISRHVAELAAMVRDRSIPRERLSGSTFTISNVGSYAGKYATPIINYPEVGILAAGRVFEGVIADRGAIRVAKLIPLSLTCDHRCVDGADAARCLALVKELIKSPESLLEPARG
ncbi:MAG: dihydrolipoamide acetyltransferase family protein [Planctomycetota bacterium]